MRREPFVSTVWRHGLIGRPEPTRVRKLLANRAELKKLEDFANRPNAHLVGTLTLGPYRRVNVLLTLPSHCCPSDSNACRSRHHRMDQSHYGCVFQARPSRSSQTRRQTRDQPSAPRLVRTSSNNYNAVQGDTTPFAKSKTYYALFSTRFPVKSKAVVSCSPPP